MDKIWHVDITTGIARTDCGFVCEFQKNTLVEISKIPLGTSTKEISQYAVEAVLAFDKARNSDVYRCLSDPTNNDIKSGCIEAINPKGYGFIYSAEIGDSLFFHSSRVKNRKFFDLNEGLDVLFRLEEGLKGVTAVDVMPKEA